MSDQNREVAVLLRANQLLSVWLAGALLTKQDVSIADVQATWEASKVQAREDLATLARRKYERGS